jgi:glycerophosphoryl diester phosphodiesterase
VGETFGRGRQRVADGVAGPDRAGPRRPVFGGRPTLIGHRGSGRGDVGGLLENSRESLLAGARAGLRWVECDIRRTADDELVIGHFPTWADGSFIARMDLSDARRQGAVTLRELLVDLPPEVGLNLDVKTALPDALRPREATTVGLLAPVAAELAVERPVLVSSFDPSVVGYLRDVVPQIPRALLTWLGFPLRKAIPAAVHLGADVVAAHWSSFGPNEWDHAPVFITAAEAIEVAHTAGLEVMSWCPQVEVARALFKAGLDAAVIDDVATTMAQLDGVAD